MSETPIALTKEQQRKQYEDELLEARYNTQIIASRLIDDKLIKLGARIDDADVDQQIKFIKTAFEFAHTAVQKKQEAVDTRPTIHFSIDMGDSKPLVIEASANTPSDAAKPPITFEESFLNALNADISDVTDV